MASLEICLVDKYPVINYLSCKLKEPDVVVWLYSKGTKPKTNPIEKKVSQHKNYIFDEYSISEIHIQDINKTCQKIVEKYPDHEITLNTTGGTKLQSLAISEFFRNIGKEFIYIDTNHSKVINIQTGNTSAFYFDLTVNEYIDLYGINMESGLRFDPKIGERSALSYFIGNNIYILSPFIDKIRDEWSRKKNDDRKFEWEIHDKYIQFSLKIDPINKLFSYKYGVSENIRLVEISNDGEEYFFRGGWLRELTFLRIHKGQYSDARLDIKLEKNSFPEGLNAEPLIDIGMIKGSKFYIFQCFAFPITRDSFVELKAISETIKLLHAEAFIILAHRPSKGFIDRAHADNLKIVYGNRISRFTI